ncbi:MAG: helix-turn-helix transcriptional regulator [Myxococcales bacterium]|nr:helix-turn-helix transcriptional regulator [Myxococcales bacterium]
MSSAEPQPPSHPLDVDAVPLDGFGLAEDLPPFDGHWHTHRKHQVFFAARGLVRLETAAARWWLPPRKAALIRAGVRHRVRAAEAIALRTVYLGEALLPATAECCVFEVEPLAREMLLYAGRWGPQAAAADPLAQPYFTLLAGLVARWSAHPAPTGGRTAQTPEVQRVLDAVDDRLATPPSLAQAARRAGLSPRTLQRRLNAELGLGWRQLVMQRRMLHALEALRRPGVQVSEVAYALGYESPGAFSRGFKAFVGESPRAYALGRGEAPADQR